MENKGKNLDSNKQKNKEMKVGVVTKMKVGGAPGIHMMKSDEIHMMKSINEGEAKVEDIQDEKGEKKEVYFDFNIKT